MGFGDFAVADAINVDDQGVISEGVVIGGVQRQGIAAGLGVELECLVEVVLGDGRIERITFQPERPDRLWSGLRFRLRNRCGLRFRFRIWFWIFLKLAEGNWRRKVGAWPEAWRYEAKLRRGVFRIIRWWRIIRGGRRQANLPPEGIDGAVLGMNVAGLEQFQGEKPEAAQKRSLKKTLRFRAGRHALETRRNLLC